jgi:hypothetical protein
VYSKSVRVFSPATHSPADTLSNLPPTYAPVDGSYANLLVGTLGIDNAVSFTNGLAANGVLLNVSWLSQTVVLE